MIAIFFYVRTIQVMFFSDVAEGTEPAAVAVPSMLTIGTIAVAVLGTLVLGVVPGPLLELAADAGQFIR